MNITCTQQMKHFKKIKSVGFVPEITYYEDDNDDDNNDHDDDDED